MIPWAWWGGALPYAATWERQIATREAVLRGEPAELLALLEHHPVVTYGRRVVPDPVRDQALGARGVEVAYTDRGGLATWHGPGQLVGYLILDARARRLAVPAVVAALERGLIRWLAGQGVQAGLRPGLPGVWLGPDKIAAVGLNFRQGVSLHGFALNLRLPPGAFLGIVPCGITDGGVCSLHQHVPGAPDPATAAASVAAAVLGALAEAGPLTPEHTGDKHSGL